MHKMKVTQYKLGLLDNEKPLISRFYAVYEFDRQTNRQTGRIYHNIHRVFSSTGIELTST